MTKLRNRQVLRCKYKHFFLNENIFDSFISSGGVKNTVIYILFSEKSILGLRENIYNFATNLIIHYYATYKRQAIRRGTPTVRHP